MASSFAALRKNRNSIDRLVQESQKLNTQATTNNNKDTRFWQATVDKAGNGFSIIRFLPESNGEDLPWVRLFSHGFQGPGGWYIENSLTNNGTDTGKEQARKQKRRLQYISNIYIVKDSGNPENEGKVFLYKFGKKIFDKCNEAMQPAFEDETPINPFDFYTGADFKLKIRKVEGYRNYDKSEFDSQSEFLDGDDDELETVCLVRVLGLDGSVSAPKTVLAVDNTVTEPPVMRQASAATTVEDDVDESLSFFEKLADED